MALNKIIEDHSYGRQWIPEEYFASPELSFAARTTNPVEVNKRAAGFVSTMSVHDDSSCRCGILARG